MIDFFGTLYPIMAVLPGMRARKTGRIALITSIGGRIATPHLLTYSAAKFATVGLGEGLAAELSRDGITVTTVVPGLMRTGSHIQARFTGGEEQREADFAWFATGASAPISPPADKAARIVVNAIRRGKHEVTFPWPFALVSRLHGLAPSTTIRLMQIAETLLPDRPTPPGESATTERGEPIEDRSDSNPPRHHQARPRGGSRLQPNLTMRPFHHLGSAPPRGRSHGYTHLHLGAPPKTPFAMLQDMDTTVGIIYLDSDRNCLAQHRLLLPDAVRIVAEPVELKDGIVTNASLAAMFDSDQLEIAARRLAEEGAQEILFACTSGSLVNGAGWDRIIAERIERASGVPGTSTTTAVLTAFRALDAKTIAIGTPYIAEVDERERAFFEQLGFTVVAIEGLGCYTDPEIGALAPETIVALAERVNRPEADIVFLSCTSLNVAQEIDRIEEVIDKPVVTSNQASAWLLMQGQGIEPRPGLFGRLMTLRTENEVSV